MRLTANFDSSEFDVSDPWPASKSGERSQLAAWLQWFRDLLGRPVIITGGYRTPARNARIGGADHSEHMEGRALDVVPIGMTNREAARRLLEAEARGQVPTFGQFIVYTDSPHLHVSLPRTDGRPNRQKLVGTKRTGSYTPLASVTDVPVGMADPLVLLALSLALLFVVWGAR